ncbi:hypothetical protein [Nonomuraea sp. NPDC049309]|uniref:hypothetical protein n=1 Tax=Nonomuraea sp. NPDC049309 TaxID=3364350 RepID=UPI00370F9095
MGRQARRLRLPRLRWLLPLMLVLGVWGMHTLGHLASHHGGITGMAAYDPVHETGPTKAAHDGMVPERRSEFPEQLMSAGVFSGSSLVSGASLWFDPTDVCLAVLPSLLIMLIAAMWVESRPRPGGRAASALWVGGVARSPPRRFAPALVELSVMRT